MSVHLGTHGPRIWRGMAGAVLIGVLSTPGLAVAGHSDQDPGSAFFSPSDPGLPPGRTGHPLDLPLWPAFPAPGHVRQGRSVPPVAPPHGPLPDRVGSGVVLQEAGPILTEAGFLDGCDHLAVALPDGTSLPARVQRADPVGDMALLATNVRHGIPLRLRAGPFHHEGVVVAAYEHGSATVHLRRGPAGSAGDHTTDDAFPLYTALDDDAGGAVFDGNGDLVGMVFSTAHPDQTAIGGLAIEGWKLRHFLKDNGVTMAQADGLSSPATEVARTRPDLLVLRVGCFLHP